MWTEIDRTLKLSTLLLKVVVCFVCLIIVCRTTQAVKIRVPENLFSKILKMALWENIGHPRYIWTDNGTNFVGLKKGLNHRAEIAKIIWNNPEIIWMTSTPLAPWQNGLSEKAAKTTKECLAMLSRKSQSLFESNLKFQRIEEVINKRSNIAKWWSNLLSIRPIHGTKPCTQLSCKKSRRHPVEQ